jgi:hypothetical protein
VIAAEGHTQHTDRHAITGNATKKSIERCRQGHGANLGDRLTSELHHRCGLYSVELAPVKSNSQID